MPSDNQRSCVATTKRIFPCGCNGCLINQIPMIQDTFNVKYTIGHGTFGHVFLASLQEYPSSHICIEIYPAYMCPSKNRK